MPRRLRDKAAGMFHVYTHCVWASQTLFRDDADRMTFLRELARARAKASWTCVGYCLMSSHYHLILDVQDEALPVGMHSLNFRYACAYNARYAMKGHVFAARYDSPRVRDDDHLLAVYRYAMRNPVRADLCAEPQDWRWSSYAATVGLAPAVGLCDPGAVLEAVGGASLDTRIARLRRLVERPDEDVTGPGPRRDRLSHALANGRSFSYVSD
jgi:putative transposase